MNKLPKSWTTVTPFSKALALSMLIVFPILGFLLGMKYQKEMLTTVDCVYSAFCEPARGGMFQQWGGHMMKGLVWIIPFLVVELILKGYALWVAGKNKQSGWFVALFVINSLGILPLIYLCFMQPKAKGKK